MHGDGLEQVAWFELIQIVLAKRDTWVMLHLIVEQGVEFKEVGYREPHLLRPDALFQPAEGGRTRALRLNE